MIKIFFALLLVLYSSVCSAWVQSVEDEFYVKKIEPKLDVLCEDVLSEAERIILSTLPSYEIMLTQTDRYFSKDTMEFLGAPAPRAQYSGVIWRGV